MKISNKTKVFVTGCGGMLGKAVFEKVSAHCQVLATDIDLNEPWLEFADVRDIRKTGEKVAKFGPDIIINLAALTDLEYCEENPMEAWKTNAMGAENMALLTKELNIPHVYIGTAGIFDGNQEFYHDFDKPNPLGIYAKAKYYGEQVVERILDKYYIFRPGWMMGGGPEKDKKFINKIFKQILTRNKDLYIVDDKAGTPTYTINFADNMFRVIQTGFYGLYNMVCKGNCSRYDVAVEFVKLLGLSEKIRINRFKSNYFSREYFAPRPESERLINLKLAERGLDYMRDWRDCLKEYAECFKKHLPKIEEGATEKKIFP